MRSFLLVLSFLFAFIFTANAQRNCGTSDYTKYLLQTDPGFNIGVEKAAAQIAATLSRKNSAGIAHRDTSTNEIIYIPVVVHLLYKTAVENISDAQVRSQIDALNKDFRRLNTDRANTPAAFLPVAADTRIQFCLAQVDPNGQKTNGIDRRYTNRDFFTTDDAMKFTASGGAASWNSNQYLNIWVVKLLGRSLAYATPPGASADKDGLVISYDVFGTVEKVRAVFNKGRTATHEIGHWLGLTHIWGDAACGTDHVDDTPAQQSYNYGCPTFPKLSACSPDSKGDMFMNYMDFSDDACMNLFTNGQARRMRALFAEGNLRNGFLNSTACDSTLAVGGPLPDTTKPAAVTVISLADSKIYPNPVQSVMTMECKAASALSLKTMRIFNSLGVVVYTKQLAAEKTFHNLDNLARGMYLVQVSDGKEVFNSRFIKL